MNLPIKKFVFCAYSPCIPYLRFFFFFGPAANFTASPKNALPKDNAAFLFGFFKDDNSDFSFLLSIFLLMDNLCNDSLAALSLRNLSLSLLSDSNDLTILFYPLLHSINYIFGRPIKVIGQFYHHSNLPLLMKNQTALRIVNATTIKRTGSMIIPSVTVMAKLINKVPKEARTAQLGIST